MGPRLIGEINSVATAIGSIAMSSCSVRSALRSSGLEEANIISALREELASLSAQGNAVMSTFMGEGLMDKNHKGEHCRIINGICQELCCCKKCQAYLDYWQSFRERQEIQAWRILKAQVERESNEKEVLNE